MDYKFDSTMNFTTIMLGHKKKQVRLQSEEIYDPFHVFPNLQNVIKKAQVRKSVDSPPGMLTEDHHHTVHEERQVCYSSHLRPKSLHL